jgi:hypothetical protein
MNKKETEKQNKILISIFVVMGILLFGFILIYFTYDNVKNFETYGMKYDIRKEGKIIFYHTSFVSNHVMPSKTVEYNVYLRTDPRTTKDIPFVGNLFIYKAIALQSDEEFNCDGDGVIAMANFNQVIGAIGGTTMRDENVTCNNTAEYSVIRLVNSNKTQVVQTGKSCYDFQIHNCEILNVTERFLLEAFSAFPESYKLY